jgi:hypothetical protein
MSDDSSWKITPTALTEAQVHATLALVAAVGKPTVINYDEGVK